MRTAFCFPSNFNYHIYEGKLYICQYFVNCILKEAMEPDLFSQLRRLVDPQWFIQRSGAKNGLESANSIPHAKVLRRKELLKKTGLNF